MGHVVKTAQGASKKCVLLIVTLLRCLTFAVQNDICALFDTRRQFSIQLLKEESFSVLTLKMVHYRSYKNVL